MNLGRAPRGPASGDWPLTEPSRAAATEPRRLKILFSEGSSTSARQSLYALGRLGHTIDICDSQRLGLGRFSRYVRRCYRAPSFSADPAGYLEFLRRRLSAERYDVLLPVHDQVFLLSRFRDELAKRTGLATPPFAAIEQLQSKIELAKLLKRLNLAQPEFDVVASPGELIRGWTYPVFVKQDHSTAGRGVWQIEDDAAMRALADRLTAGSGSAQPLLVQRPAQGEYQVLQAVFRRGELVAWHAYASLAKGVGGSAHARVGVESPLAVEAVERIGEHLTWHGALHMEYFYDAHCHRAEIMEINPRIGETMNATASGVNLCQALVEVSLELPVTGAMDRRERVHTHSIISSLLGAAQRGAGRRQLLAELAAACRGRGVYADSQDELVRPGEDPPSLIPAAWILARLLIQPRSAERIIQNAVEHYSLDQQAIDRIESLPHGEA
jgi:predicted ATP-grasp superfamily ATP-dependent carboligase